MEGRAEEKIASAWLSQAFHRSRFTHSERVWALDGITRHSASPQKSRDMLPVVSFHWSSRSADVSQHKWRLTSEMWEPHWPGASTRLQTAQKHGGSQQRRGWRRRQPRESVKDPKIWSPQILKTVFLSLKLTNLPGNEILVLIFLELFFFFFFPVS